MRCWFSSSYASHRGTARLSTSCSHVRRTRPGSRSRSLLEISRRTPLKPRTVGWGHAETWSRMFATRLEMECSSIDLVRRLTSSFRGAGLRHPLHPQECPVRRPLQQRKTPVVSRANVACEREHPMVPLIIACPLVAALCFRQVRRLTAEAAPSLGRPACVLRARRPGLVRCSPSSRA